MWVRLILTCGLLAFGCVSCDSLDRLDITTTTLAQGKVGQTYHETIQTTGGHGDFMIRVLNGQLPPGIAFRQVDRNAELYGTPSLAGDYLFTVEACDMGDGSDHHDESTVSRGFVLTIQP